VTTLSVVIPTLNAGPSLRECVRSVRAGSPPGTEIIVVDSLSTDGSTEGIAGLVTNLVSHDSSATRARLVGCQVALGEYVLNLDADQRLKVGGIQRALLTGAEIVALGEDSRGPGLVAKANRLHNARLHADWSDQIHPVAGGVIPRLYRRSRLTAALERIPPQILDIRPCPYAEDSLIFLEASRDAPRVDFVPDVLAHEEESSVLRYIKKWYRYGITAKAYRGTPYEAILTMRAKTRTRGALHPSSFPAFLLRSPGFVLGYWL
jgi:glycosyltransferase involved in cell wall biosynthesis